MNSIPNNKDISVVIPIYNEAKIIPELIRRLKETVSRITPNYELIFVNDGSKDESLLVLRSELQHETNAFYIDLSRNFGHQIAVSAGLDASNGNAVVIIDGDLQDPPELIAEMYAKHQEGFEVVYAQRRQRKGESWFKKITAKWFYRILKRLTDFPIPLDTGDFRLIDRKIVEGLKQMPEKNKFLRGQIAWLGFRQTSVLYDRDERKHGTTGYTIGKMLRLAMDGITGFSDKPLLFVSRLGILISMFAIVLIGYAIYAHYFLKQTITGWTSLMVSLTFFGGIQLISVGVIGEYISRINRNTLNRPLYMISETNLPKNTSSNENE